MKDTSSACEKRLINAEDKLLEQLFQQDHESHLPSLTQSAEKDLDCLQTFQVKMSTICQIKPVIIIGYIITGNIIFC